MVFTTRRLFGCDFVSEATLDDVAAWVLDSAARPDTSWQCVVTPNVDHVVRYDRNPAERAVADHATVVLPDGMPVVWASKLLRRPLRARLAGSDLFAMLWPELGARRTPVVALVSDDITAEGLRAVHPGARTVVPGRVDTADDAAVDALVAALSDACDEVGAELLFVGLSMDKHHLIADRLRRRWLSSPPASGRWPLVLLVGASAELYLGHSRRAPRWLQRIGLEWLHRLLQDPRRLARRYLVEDMAFVRMVWRESRRPAPLAAEVTDG